MYWLQRPPYVRWAAAALLVAGAAAWDLRPEPTASHPFLTSAVPAGTEITPAHLEWRRVPDGLLPPVDGAGAVAAADLEEGDPLVPSMLTRTVAAPEGWWEVPVEAGTRARPGDRVMLVVVDPPAAVVGIVLAAQEGDPYSLGYRPAAVAVPAEDAPLIAAASAQGALVAAVQPATPPPG
ncbi:MAG: hypothetical protein KQH83_06140 [Actinobacteria bacterium]|nr:hypothetical protein [Actinomycetota bacterium]